MHDSNEEVNPFFLSAHLSDSTVQEYSDSSNVRILRESLSMGIFPLSENDPGEISISGRDKQRAERLLGTLERGDYYVDRVNLYSCLNILSRYLSYNGKVSYEILSVKDSEYALFPISQQGLFMLFGYAVQRVPSQFRSEFRKSLVIKPKHHVWQLEMPEELMTTKNYKKLLKRLAELTELTPKKIPFSEHRPNSPIHYKNTQQFIYSEINNIGGTQRSNELDYINEYYYIYREVKLNRARAIIREHIVKELNFLFENVGFDAKIEVSGVPSVHDIEHKLIQLKAGDTGLDGIFDATRV
ncbi:hypothetical protein [Pseudoalteromonas ruthenica]|uniref:hypothetical protein n=1 Tax=Pseudoalteromonas ruthenica TaxID=151081 RepID=UPI00110B284E|nr:hypothetical protein [Pseudoalteromonas ruthenica]TMO45534.1 hypothetical protein CWC24_12115 [Pseudoalteromonas ruthenica]TMO48472.1 hypothetical protein CWC23_17690 [Pseudoalteromonas ruthenica]